MFVLLIPLFALIMTVNGGVSELSDAKIIQNLEALVDNVHVQSIICIVVDGKIISVFTPNQFLLNINNLNQLTASTALIALSDSFVTIADLYTTIDNAFVLYNKPLILFLTRNTSSAVSMPVLNKCVYNNPLQIIHQNLGILGLIYAVVRLLTALEIVCDVAHINILKDTLGGLL